MTVKPSRRRGPAVKAACSPELVTKPDRRFDQVHELMLRFFDPSVVEEKSWHAFCLAKRLARPVPAPGAELLLVCTNRSGLVTSFLIGTYMPLMRLGHRLSGGSIGAIGYMVTRKGCRGQGQGTALIRAFLEECRTVARMRDENLVSLVTESEDDSKWFFYKQGFLWPRPVYYAQPPLRYSLETGAKRFPEVPEHLMLRLTSPARAASRLLLARVVHALYHYWVIEKFKNHRMLGGTQAMKAISGYVFGKVFNDFAASLRMTSEPAPLTRPLPSCIQAQRNGISIRPLTEEDRQGPPKRRTAVSGLRPLDSFSLASGSTFLFIDQGTRAIGLAEFEPPLKPVRAGRREKRAVTECRLRLPFKWRRRSSLATARALAREMAKRAGFSVRWQLERRTK